MEPEGIIRVNQQTYLPTAMAKATRYAVRQGRLSPGSHSASRPLGVKDSIHFSSSERLSSDSTSVPREQGVECNSGHTNDLHIAGGRYQCRHSAVAVLWRLANHAVLQGGNCAPGSRPPDNRLIPLHTTRGKGAACQPRP